ncbi:Uma2 family endonuclease [Streptomyces sp. NPDC048603]|uniref:Uma2 family endonuclease n=1 Tax=Streptomyces sp. NPDC048603 TaxID=3365577 RepID=UPI00371DAC99
MDREADVTVSETERLHSQLSRFEDMFPGYRVEIVEGAIMMSPVKPHHNETIFEVRNALKAQLSAEWGLISDVAVPFDDDNELCPDLAVIPNAERRKNLSAYPPELIELAVEVVSPSSVRNDYEVKNRAYARRGIPHYLIFDPYKGHCVTLWNPGPDGYVGRDTIPYGNQVKIDTGIGTLVIDTAELPVDPGTAVRT